MIESNNAWLFAIPRDAGINSSTVTTMPNKEQSVQECDATKASK